MQSLRSVLSNGMADEDEEQSPEEGEEPLTPTPASEWRRAERQQPFRLEMGDLPGLQAFFRELNRSLAQQWASSEVFARVAQQQREYVARLFESSSVLANFNARMAPMLEELTRAAMPIETYRRLAAALVANMPRDLVIEVPTIESTVQVGEPTVVIEPGPRELMGVRLDMKSIGLIVFWIYYLQRAIEALARGDIPGFDNLVAVAIACAYALSEYDKRQR